MLYMVPKKGRENIFYRQFSTADRMVTSVLAHFAVFTLYFIIVHTLQVRAKGAALYFIVYATNLKHTHTMWVILHCEKDF